uniref:Non-ribosomal peptide synthetase/polyketide synthase n=1 Tax=Myxococcus xanthus TaxID=34 RepID=G0LWV1_MYXXA|nr:non-ribosomal peptide synthetase/polyketide synthase [Myxococcus xanthus]
MVLLQLLGELKAHGIVLWLKGGGQLGYSVPKDTGFPDALKEQVRQHKGELLDLLALNGIDSAQRARDSVYLKLPAGQRPRALHSIQKGMYLQSRIDALPYTYTIPLFVRLQHADLERLDAALVSLLERHPILRMSVAEDLSFTFWELEQHPIQHVRVESVALSQACEARARMGFEPGAPLLRPEVLEVTGTPDVVVSLCHHHLLSDAYSAELLVQQLMACYEASGDGATRVSPDDASRALDYFDHAAYQQVECDSPTYREARRVLVRKLEQAQKLQLKRKKVLASQENHAGTLTFTLDADTCQRLRGVASGHNLGLYSLLFTALYQTLATFSNSEPGFPIGLTVANRPDEFRHAIGPFINTLPLVPEYQASESFLWNAERVQQELLFLNQHHQLNVNMLAEQMGNSEELSELMQVLFTLHNFKPVDRFPASISYEVLPHPDLAEKFGITLVAREHREHVSFTVTYARDSFEEAFIQALLDGYQTLLSNLTTDSVHQPVHHLSLLSPSERQRILVDWNETEAAFEGGLTAAQLFERQVLRTPDNLAVIYQDTRLTYRDLNARANQLAHWLRTEGGVAPESLVCLCLDRSEDMLVAVLGILKAGCAYVPIDPSFPPERRDFILEDTRAPVLLTQERHLPSWRDRQPSAHVFAIDSASTRATLAQHPRDNPASVIDGEALAYVIYTSGTTGKPKGVMSEHTGLVNRLQWMNKQYPLQATDKILQKTTYVFDVSVWELLWANWYGACVVFAEPEGHKDVDYLLGLMERESISVVHFVPSMFGVFLDSLRARATPSHLSSLRYIFCSGEALPLNQVRDTHALLPAVRLHNLYGPTEASIDVLHFDCTDRALDSVPIGKPIDNTQVYVLNEALRPLPIHAIGELFLGGVGLARGYLNRPELTAQRFIPNPFAAPSERDASRSRLYRTGDLVRWLPDGNLEYLGRNDFQVKIRGQRVELGEIEAALARFPGVKQGLALVRTPTGDPDAAQVLVGYYVSAHPLDEAALLRHLNEKLPQHMVPSALVFLPHVPLTLNGKLDRNALPAPRRPEREQYVPPRDPREEQLRALWAERLGLEAHRLGIRDDLFSLGMDSIIAIQLVSRLRQQLALKVTVKDVFAHKTLERFYDHLLAREAEQTPASESVTEQGLLEGELGLLPIQSWFFAQDFARPAHWNQAFLVKTPPLAPERLEEALRALVLHHDAFRLRYEPIPGKREPRQFYAPSAPVPPLRRLDVRTLAAAEGTAAFQEELHQRLTDWQSHFDLHQGPLHCFGLVEGYAEGGCRLFFALHHLIVDSVSWHILIDDLQALYEQRPLGAKGSSYRQWVASVARYQERHAAEREFWRKLLADHHPSQHPWLYASAPGTPHQRQLSLDEAQTDVLLRSAHRAYHTQVNDLLLTAIGYALREMDGNPIHHLMVEGHGREEFDATLDITRTLGWFTTLYPVRLSVASDLGEGLKQVKEALRAIPEKGLGFGSLLGYGEQPLPPICFNYLGQLDRDGAPPDAWRLVPEDGGDAMPSVNQSGVLLNIFAFVVNGRFHLRLDSRMEMPLTERFLLALERQLSTLLTYCLEKQGGEYTPSDFHGVTGEADLAALPLLPRPERGEWFAMTEIQKAYLIGRLGHYEIGNVANHIYNEYHHPQLDIDRLEAALNRLIAECDVLRTVYSIEHLRQRYLPLEDIPPYVVRVHRFEAQRYTPALLEPVRARLSHHVYDAERFPLFTFEVSRFEDRSVLHISIDLLILDVQSRLMLLGLLNDLYRGVDIRPRLPRVTFKDYQDHASLLKESRWYQSDKAYWQARLPTLPLRPSLAFKQSPESITQPRFAEHTLYVEPGTWARFKAQAQRNNVSYSSALLGLFGSLISYFSGSREFLITLTLFNRYAVCADVEAILGDFTSTTLFHFDQTGPDAQSLLRRTHDVLWEDISHALYSGLEVQRELSRLHGLDSHKAVSPIIFTGVVGNQTRQFERTSFLEDSELIEQRYWCAQTSQAWIDLQAIEVGDRFMSKWLYVEQLFDAGYIEHLNRLYCALIEHLAEHDWREELPFERYLPTRDRDIIHAANQATLDRSDDTLFSAYERNCRERGLESAIAVVDLGRNERYTYATLLSHTERLARVLYQLGGDTLEADGSRPQLLGVLLEKGYHQVVACCAIMKAGYGYLPMHSEWPAGRVGDVLSQAGASLLLVSQAQYDDTEVRTQLGGRYRLLVIDELLARADEEAPAQPLPQVDADAVAYVIFTSGSTGKPKGVTISHRGALNTIHAVNQRLAVSPTDKVLALSELSFDLSVYDLFGLLAAGGQVVFTPPRATKDPSAWLEAIEREQVTLWNTVPQLAGLLVDAMKHGGKTSSSLRAFMLSGDWIPTRLPEQLRALAPNAEVLSMGGATEGSIWSIWYPVETVPAEWTSIPYGVAMPNQKMYVLSPALCHCPVGVTGEIHIGGMGVALGYWRDETLSRARYIEHPTLGRLYKTGDLGRWSAQGYIEFLGRNDFQVKLRGHRVELGEIENALLRHPAIKQSVVLVKNQGQGGHGAQYLVGYYVAEQALDEQALLERLATSLPEYMVPAALVHLRELPLTANGKLDRNALPVPGLGGGAQRAEPRDEREASLRAIWAKVLGMPEEQLGIRDDLLRLGMDSIVSIQMVGRLRQHFGVKLSVRDIFAHKTIERFYDQVLRDAVAREDSNTHGEEGPLTGEVPLSPIQSWFFAHRFPRAHHWNQSFLVRTPALSLDELQGHLNTLVARHDAFSLRYRMTPAGEPTQIHTGDAGTASLRHLDVRTLGFPQGSAAFEQALQDRLTEWQGGFDLEHGPTHCFGYLDGYQDGSSRVFFALHHLIVDGVSWRILAEDLATLCRGEALGAKGTSVRQWGRAMDEYAQRHDDERAYWRGVLADYQPPAQRPPSGAPVELHIAFSELQTRQLLRNCPRAYNTQVGDLLLTAFAHALRAVTGDPVHHILMEGHGRENIAEHLDVSRTLGWFTSMFPVRLSAGEDLLDSLKSIKDQQRAIPNKGVGYGALFGYSLGQLPHICFNYLGQVGQASSEHGDWQIVDEPGGVALHPDNLLPYSINLAGMVAGGHLRFILTCRTEPERARRLAHAFEASLAELIQRTASCSRRYLTVSDLDLRVSPALLERLQAERDIEDVFLANSLQQGFIYHALQQAHVDEAYRVQAVWEYPCTIDPALLEDAWRWTQRAYSSLRLRFDWQEEMLQVVDRKGQLNWRYLDLVGQSPALQDEAFEQLLATDRNTPYDLSAGSLFRVYLLKRGETSYTCLFNTHHAILDGWSSPLLLDTVHGFYRALVKGRPPELPVDSYPASQRYLQRHHREHEAFWRAYLSDLDGGCDLGGLLREGRVLTDIAQCKRVQRQGQRGLSLSPARMDRLRSTAREAGVTPNVLLQYAWHKALSIFGRSAQTVVGTVVAGRDLPVDHIELSVGLHLNTLPLRVRHTSPASTLREELLRLQGDVNDINQRSTIDLASLQRNGERLFNSLFIYENYPNSANTSDDRLINAVFKARYEKRDYPLVVSIGEQHGGLVWHLDFAEELFEPAAIERLLSCVEQLLIQLEGDLERSPTSLSFLSEAQAQWVLRGQNATDSEQRQELTIHQAFERVVAASPAAVAIEHRGRTLSYGQLNALTNKVARHALRQLPLRAEEPVLMLVDRGEATMVGLLAILKMGAAYIPVEPTYPDDRVARILADSKTRLVLTQGKYQQRLARLQPDLTTLALDSAAPPWSEEAEGNLSRPVAPTQLAYILYTSGTTGQPKGVMIEHRAFMGTLRALREQYFPTPGPLSTYSMTNYVFDIFGLEYGLPLLSGGRLHLGDTSFTSLSCAEYDFIQMTPSLLEMKLDALISHDATRLLVGGERLERHLLNKVRRCGLPLVNVYGPTETTIWSTSRAYLDTPPDDTTPVTIGRPLANETAYLLDAQARLLPVGAVGELHLGGEAVARGYFNRPELTAERFIANPFQTADERRANRNARLYKTGDLARWRENGELEFLGRVDNQVKIRGHRIELGEIESAIVRFPGVKQGLARIAHLGASSAEASTANQVLLGYYLSDAPLDERALAAHLATLLPDYMLPNALLHLRQLPLTVNGKLDVTALPLPGGVRSKSITPPRGEVETLLAGLWKEVLGLEQVGVHERFFELGGNSILLTKLYIRLPGHLRERVSMVELFKYPTIAMLSEHLQGGAPREEAPTARAERVTTATGHQDIAIIGMAGRFPMADDLREFWDNLASGHEATQHYSREELLEAGVPASLLEQPGYVRAQSRLRDFKSFDAAFFGYSPKEAELMDPQHRLFLECAWHALEDAGCDPFTYQGNIGVYAGAGQNNYDRDYVQPTLDAGDLSAQYQVMVNTQANFLCTKVAYKLNLTGPAVTVQTACSSSLVAVHQACLALQSGDCDVALAGGVSIGQLEKRGYLHQEGLVFSPDGRCRAFDSAAQGTLEGQGVGIVVLKPLERALADGDAIRAVIKATAINNDGRDKIGYTAPSQKRQADVIRAAHRKAGISPRSISYIEAHGTGTVLGDPIEFEGLKAAFGDTPGPAPYCALGSVKTNIGHLDVAAGIAGLIKTVLCLEHRTLVPTLHFQEPNPRMDFEHGPFYVNTQTRPWTAEGPLRAGVSSFGIGGTNAHVVLEQAPPSTTAPTPTRPRAQHLLVLSAHSAEALERQAAQLATHLEAHPQLDLNRVAYTLQVARHRFPHHRVVVGADREALLQALHTPQPGLLAKQDVGPVVFMFPGQGAQYAGMGRSLYEHEPRFRGHVERCLAILQPHLSSDMGEEDILGWNERVHHTQVTQPALFILEYALARWFIDLGIRPAAMIGHSLGEYTAACLAGVFSLEDALLLVLERGRLLASLPESRMLAVSQAAHALREQAERYGVDIAAINEDNHCILSGGDETIGDLAAALAKKGIASKPLKVSHAFHSRLLDPVLAQFEARVARLRLQPPRLPFLSNTTGAWADPAEVVTPRYWAQHLRQTVRFHDGLTTLLQDTRLRQATCIEVGPSHILTRLAQRHPARGDSQVLPTQPRAEQPERACADLATALGRLWGLGHAIDSDAYHGLSAKDRVRLPAYPFTRQSHWIGAEKNAPPAASPPRQEPTSFAGDELTEAVADIWRRLLGVPDARLDDDFFEQGGDSLAAVRLVAAIERRLGLKLEFMSLEQHTLRAISTHLQQHLAGHTFSDSSLVVLKKGNPQAEPLVLVHPIGGDVYFYRELAQCLPPGQPVLAIRSPMLDGGARFDSIEAMAEAYVALLESQGVHPPYRLGGSSFGGIVAYHMAGIVERRHGFAPGLALIDSPAHGNLPTSMNELEILDYLARYGLRGLSFSHEALSALPSLEEKVRYLASRARGTAFEDMLSAEFLPRFIRTWLCHGELMQRYVPAPYGGPLLFFSHQEPIAEFPSGQYSHWRKLVTGPCQEISIPGNHLSMNTMPNVAHIAEALRQHSPLVTPSKEST